MSLWTEEELEKFHHPDFRKKERLKESGQLGCFSCGYIFSYYLVENFLESENTALCPICGIDAVIPLIEFPESQHEELLGEMYLKYFKREGQRIPLSTGGHFFLLQKRGELLYDVYNEIKKIFNQSDREHQKNIYEIHEYAQSLSFQINSGQIMIYPLDKEFIQYILPELSKDNHFLMNKKNILTELIKKRNYPSFIITLPAGLIEKEAGYIVKIIGMATGGYFANIKQLPADGILTKKEHIYIRNCQNQAFDIINNIEELLEKYS